MKKIMSTCIVLVTLGITYQYVETIGVYQIEVEKGEKISADSGDLTGTGRLIVELNWTNVISALISISNNRGEYGEAMDIYYPLLAEYERAWKDKDYYDEYGYIMSDYRFGYLSNSMEYNSLWYALADLADDGSAELVIGIKFDEKYLITTIYSYNGDSIYCADVGPDGDRTLYEMGIYEVYIGMRGVGLFEYYQFKEDLPQAEFVIGLTDSYEDEKYYKYTEPENFGETEITEEEFQEIKEQYQKDSIELEWQELKGYDREIMWIEKESFEEYMEE